MILAIIDIGSNAVRSVVYSDNSMDAHELYHERFKIDLRGLFGPDPAIEKHPFYVVINRFIDIFQKLKVEKIKCVATAILRDNPKSADFCKAFYQKYKINIEIISGQQEAFLSSCGLLMGSPNPHGIIADLGGGSLEIAEVHAHKINKLTSLPIGTQVLNAVEDLNLEYITSRIKAAYQNPVKSKLYLIGGGFRIIAKSYINHTKYPLYNIHNLEIDQQDLSKYLEHVQENYKAIFGTARTHDRYSVIVLQSLIEIFQPSKVLVSNYGLKEGVRYTTLPTEERYKDVIFERCKAFVGYVDDSIDLDGYAYVIQQVLHTKEEEFFEINDIIKIALIFLHFRSSVDRNFYGHFLSHAILMCDIPFTHKQRASLAFIASAAFGKPNNYIQQLVNSVLKNSEYKTASIVAKIINIALMLDGPHLAGKCSFAIDNENGKLLIKTCETLPFNLYHNINKQLKSIAKINIKHNPSQNHSTEF